MVTKSEFAEIMKVHLNTVDKWIKNGMPVIKQGMVIRIDENDAIAWLKENNI